MKIFINPVSGGSFVHQIASMQLMTSLHKKKPDLCLCSSGGCVATHIAQASKWDPYSMSRLATRLSPSLILKPYSKYSLVNIISSYLNGCVYSTGDTVEELFVDLFVDKKFFTETWIGVYNKTKRVHKSVCNREVSCIGKCNANNEMIGDHVKKISMYSQASASIPVLVPPVRIEGDDYQDGGVSCASPLIDLYEQLVNIKSNIQVVYITPINPIEESDKPKQGMIGSLRNVTEDMIRSSIINDEILAMCLIKSRGRGKLFTQEGEGIPLDLLNQLDENNSEYILYLYPKDELSIDITTFTSADISESIIKCANMILYKIHYAD